MKARIIKLFTNKKFLLGTVIAGVALTAGTAIAGTIVAQKHIKEKEEEIKKDTADQLKIPVEKVENVSLTTKETLQTVWKDYIPTAGALALTIGAATKLFGVMNKENIALQGLLAMSESTVRHMERKMVDEIGEEKAHARIAEVKQDVLSEEKLKEPSRRTERIVNKFGDEVLRLCEPYTKRKFKTTKLKLQQAIEDVNLELITYGEADMNVFYSGIDEEESEAGEIIGWRKKSINGDKVTVNVTGPGIDSFVDNEGIAWTIIEFSDRPDLILD